MTTLRQGIMFGGLLAIMGAAIGIVSKTIVPEPSFSYSVTTTQASENINECFNRLKNNAVSYSSLIDYCTSPIVISGKNRDSLVFDYIKTLIPSNY